MGTQKTQSHGDGNFELSSHNRFWLDTKDSIFNYKLLSGGTVRILYALIFLWSQWSVFLSLNSVLFHCRLQNIWSGSIMFETLLAS